METLPNADFSFKSLLHLFKGNSSARFICSICLKPGRLLLKPKTKKDGDNEGTEAEVDDHEFDDVEEEDDQSDHEKKSKKGRKRKDTQDTPTYTSLPSNHVKKATKLQKLCAQRLAETEARVAAEDWPILVPCAGRCPNYVHVT